MSTAKSKFRGLKILINIILIALLGLVLFQNSNPIPVEFLMWEVNIPLALILIATAIIGALITLVTVLIKGR